MRKHPRARCPSFARLAPILPLMLVACSTLTHYPDETRDLMENFEAGSVERALAEAEERWDKGLDRLAYLLEGGMILHVRGKPEESNAAFDEAESVIRYNDEKAVLSLSKGTAQLGTLVVNEKTLPYRGEPFEKVLVNTYKAKNYLFLHDYEGARVEIRRSFARQQENRRMHEKEYQRMEEEAREKGLSSSSVLQAVQTQYEDQRDIVQSVKNLYEDAFAYYLSAIVYELNREYNDAYIDLEKVQQLRPGVPYVEDDLLRTARLSGLSEGLKQWMDRFGRPPRFLEEDKEGEVLVFFGCGMAPQKRQIKISIPIPDVGWISLAFPKYETVPSPIAYAALYEAGGGLYGRTYVLTDLEAIAIRSLNDRLTTLALKQALRAALKGAMVKTARDQGGWAGDLVANLYNVITEQADLRSWQTLPQNIQVARFPLPAGAHELILALHGSTGGKVQERAFSLDIRPGERVFVNARSGASDLIGFNVYPLGPRTGDG